MIQYLHANQLIAETDLAADLTLLDYLRNQRGLTATKEGCASGDCGACTVALGRLDEQGELVYESINSCICPAAELHGAELVTAADLQQGEQLHPVQQAFIEAHASQCGFCTPGFIVSAFVFLESKRVSSLVSADDVSQAIAGNLCRCTGYGPIIHAVETAAQAYTSSVDRSAISNTLEQITQMPETSGLRLPTSLAQLGLLQTEYQDSQLIAGGTDLMLEVTQRLQTKPRMIGLSRIGELQQITEQGNRVEIGAGVTFNKLYRWARDRMPQLAQLLLHIGSEQVRNRGTVGGNLGTASPIGDLPPVLLALQAQVKLWHADATREMPLDQFFTGYRATRLGEAEIIHSVSFELPSAQQRLVIEKVSKRKEDDISALLLAARFELNGSEIVDCSLGLGGVAATPVTAPQVSDGLQGSQVGDWSYDSLYALLQTHLAPLDDLRASAGYRLHCATALLLDALQGSEVRDEA